MPATKTVTLSAALFLGTRTYSTVFISVEGSEHAGQVVLKGKDHAARAAAYIIAVTGTFDAVSAILAIDSANATARPSITPGFGFAAVIIEVAQG